MALAAAGCGGDDDSGGNSGFFTSAGGTSSGGSSSGGSSSGANGSGAASSGGTLGLGIGGSATGGSGGGGACDPNLTGLLRDFRAAHEADGHPDFEAYLGTGDGIVAADLGSDLKPVYPHNGPFFGNDNAQLTTNKAAFDQWYRDTHGVNTTEQLTLTLTEGEGGISTYENPEFFPMDGKGFGNYEPFQNGLHNFHFTFELHTEFAYNGGEIFTFTGDDDLWVFINRKLAIDIGGVHGQLTESVALDDIAQEFGLQEGGTYALDLFHAERHTSQSYFRIDTSLEFTNCDPILIPK